MNYTVPPNISEIRKRAWETRRATHGPRGHSSSYSRSPGSIPDTEGMLSLIIKLHNEGVLSEGQVAKATGIHRITIRKIADEAMNGVG